MKILNRPPRKNKNKIATTVELGLVSLILVICRLLNPSSELHIAEHYYKSTALADLLGVPDDRINDDRLYRGLDKLLPKTPILVFKFLETLFETFDFTLKCSYFHGNGNIVNSVRKPEGCTPRSWKTIFV